MMIIKGDGDTNYNWSIWNGLQRLEKRTEKLEISGRIDTIQTTASLRSVWIFRRVLVTWGDLLSHNLLWKITNLRWFEELEGSEIIWYWKMCHAHYWKMGKEKQRKEQNYQIKNAITLLEKGKTTKYSGVFETDTIKQAEMKKKEEEYIRRTKKRLETKLCNRNQRDKHLGSPSCKIPGIILGMDTGGTQTNEPKD